MTAELPVWVFGRCRWVSGVCRRTTCHDVLEAVLATPNPSAAPDGEREPGTAGAATLDAANYVIVERWKGVERRLDGRVRILKVWSAWGEAQSEVQLQVRRVSEKAGRHSATAGSRRHRKRSGPGPAGSKPRPSRPSPTVKQHDQEEVHRLMRLILAQGETIAGQLRRLREREAQIERLEAEAHRERVAQHGKDYVLAAYLRDNEDDHEADDQGQPQDTPRTTRQQPGRPGGGIRPRQLVADDDLSHFADESDAEHERLVAAAGTGAGGGVEAGGNAPVPGSGQVAPGSSGTPEPARSRPADQAVEECDPDAEGDVRARIALWEKVVKVNKRLEQQEERLVRLYVGFRRSAPDGLAVDDREQLRSSLTRLQQDIDDGRRSLQVNADLLTETEALLDAKRRLLRRLLAEMEAAEMDTSRLMAARDAARDAAVPADTLKTAVAPPTHPVVPAAAPITIPITVAAPCAGQLSQLTLPQSQGKGLDNDSNSDTGLSSLHSSSEEGVYILDTLV